MRLCHYWIGYLINNLPSQGLERQGWGGSWRRCLSGFDSLKGQHQRDVGVIGALSQRLIG